MIFIVQSYLIKSNSSGTIHHKNFQSFFAILEPHLRKVWRVNCMYLNITYMCLCAQKLLVDGAGIAKMLDVLTSPGASDTQLQWKRWFQ